MNLCSKCSSIDFAKLPPLHAGYFYYPAAGVLLQHAQKMGLTYSAPFIELYQLKRVKGKEDAEPPAVYKHHRYQSLQKRHSTCPLCDLIFDAATQLQRSLDSDVVFNDRYGPGTDNFRVFLTGCDDSSTSADGFMIWTKSRARSRWLPLRTARLCVNEGDPLGAFFSGRRVPEDPNSPTAWSWVHRTIGNGLSAPEESVLQLDPPELPSRVIDVGPADCTSVRLLESEGMKCRYITLSYMWPPGDPKLTGLQRLQRQWKTLQATTSSNFEGRLVQFDGLLPNIYQDAITITRKLGIRYLWIDALCIKQDDDMDKANQIPKMGEIYANSYLTISATWQEGSHMGCLALRSPPKYSIFSHETNNTTGTLQAFLEPYGTTSSRYWNTILGKERISTRGWTFQERVLSARTLYYARGQMYFEDGKTVLGEDGISINPAPLAIPSEEGDLRQYWIEMVTLYSSRSISYPSDRLPAIAGVAKMVYERLPTPKDNYIAGFWGKDLLRSITWSPNSVRNRIWPATEYIAPSWSWAAAECKLDSASRFGSSIRVLAELLSWSVTLKFPGDIYGEVTGGYLLLRAPMIPVSVLEEEHSKVAFKMQTISGSRLQYNALLDYKIDEEELKKLSLYALVVLEDSDASENWFRCLLVTPLGGIEAKYCRIGSIMLRRIDLGVEAPGPSTQGNIIKLI